jgi:hypothetical protein
MERVWTVRLASYVMLGWSMAVVGGQAQDPANTPEKALEAFKAAVEAGSVKGLANLLAGEEGITLRRIAEPFEKAKAANDRFERALKEMKIDFKNPFAASFSPFLDMHLDIVKDETTKKSEREYLARVKYGPRGKAQEETVLVVSEGGTWRVGAPSELAKTLPSPDRRDRQAIAFEKLAEVLDKLAVRIERKEVTTKEQVGLQLLKLFRDEKLAELLQ